MEANTADKKAKKGKKMAAPAAEQAPMHGGGCC